MKEVQVDPKCLQLDLRIPPFDLSLYIKHQSLIGSSQTTPGLAKSAQRQSRSDPLTNNVLPSEPI